MHLHRLGCAQLVLTCMGMSLSAGTYEVAQRDPRASDEGPGTREQPWRTLPKAAQTAGPGDVIVIRDGIYRERIVIQGSGTEQKPIRFEASPGAYAMVTGADRLTGWRKVESDRPIYSVAWPHRFITWSKYNTHPDDEYHRLIGRCEQVAIDGYLLRQVLDRTQLSPGSFFVDSSSQVLEVWDPSNRDLNKVFAEASVRQELLRVEGEYVEVRGLRFSYAANMAQRGAVMLTGAHDILEDCVIERMNASGAAFSGQDQTVRRCVFRDNGQLGFGANRAHRLLFTECLVENNNIKGFDRGWEAGGNKLVLCRDAVLERSQLVRNRGNGIWFDIGNEHCTVRHCLIADNEGSGIFYEISFGLQAHDNVITGNGFATTAGAWGAQAGISVSSSPDCVIEHNLILGNREGFNFREQTRTTPRIGAKEAVPVWNHDEVISKNIIAFNRDAQIWGWFDVKDNRHWPSAEGSDGRTSQADHQPRGNERNAQPNGHTLKDLWLRFGENVYFAGPGQGWFEWGVTWGRHQSYSTLADFQSALGIDAGSRVLEPRFANLPARDFRLSAKDMRQVEQSYPRGPVPGVLLGVLP
jgi:hypothetical protein